MSAAAARLSEQVALRKARAKMAETDPNVRLTYVSPNVVTLLSFREDAYYYVLLGSRLSVTPRAEQAKPVKVPLRIPGRVDAVVNLYASSKSELGPPYRVPVACSCPDWLIRGGLEFAPGECPELTDIAEGFGDTLAAEHNQEYRDAAQGCKHMMLCNTQLMHNPAVTLGPSWHDAQKLKAFQISKPKRKAAGPYELAGSRYNVGAHDVVVDEDF